MRTLPLRSFALLAALAASAGCIASSDDAGDDEDVGTSDDAICPGGPTIHGVDVSYYQGSIDWAKAKASGVKFAVARVGDGASYHDPKFVTNWKALKAHGIVRGTYQFFRPEDSPVAQANLVINDLKKAGGFHPGDIPPALDIEVQDGVSDKTTIARMHTWISHIQATLDRTPLIYTAPGFWSGLGNPKSFAKDDVWVAHWFVNCPTLPAGGFKTFKFWQYSDAGHVPGISGGVDMDRFNGSLAQLHDYTDGQEDETTGLGGNVSSRPIITKNADGRLEVFATNSDGKVETAFEQVSGPWSGWFSMGGDFVGAPGIGMIADGRLMMTARDDKGDIWHATQSGPNGSFGKWTSLGGSAAENPTMARDVDGRLHVFVVDEQGDVEDRYRAPSGAWSSWTKIANTPGALTGITVARRSSGKLVLFVRGASNGELYMVSENAQGSFGALESLGGDIQSAPTAARNEDGRLEVFARGDDGSLHHIYETSPGGAWSKWASLGGQVHQPWVAANKDGRLEVFVRGDDDALWHIEQKAPNSGWHAWHSLKSKILGAPIVMLRGNGHLSVFAKVKNGHVLEVTQKSPGTF